MRFPEPGCSRAVSRIAAAALIAACVAACSDPKRFGDSALSNPFASRQEAAAPLPPAEPAPVARVDAQPLSSQNAAPLPPPGPAPGYYGQRDTTGSIAGEPSWNSGGSTMTVAQGDTIDAIARRYGVPARAIIDANHIASPASIRPGQQLVIPTPDHQIRPTQVSSAAPRPAKTYPKGAPGGVHVVAPGETLSSVARLYGKSRTAVAKANHIPTDAKLQIGQQLVVPGAKPTQMAAAAPAHPPAPVGTGHALGRPSHPPQRVATADAGPIGAPVAEAAPAPKVQAVEPAGSSPGFRWPVRGRVIAGFGPETNGQRNDGINLAVPEGTSIKAAEEGTVAYAGNELKGYGNLLLVRHSNGFVTAYAHASELLVKRGDQVKRGQIIARAGQTGSVSSPQLHFEIRKGATPVDPVQYLPGT
jgi:murein DD-endopeptidase MepM/ murein hydrolase activator NlpD